MAGLLGFLNFLRKQQQTPAGEAAAMGGGPGLQPPVMNVSPFGSQMMARRAPSLADGTDIDFSLSDAEREIPQAPEPMPSSNPFVGGLMGLLGATKIGRPIAGAYQGYKGAQMEDWARKQGLDPMQQAASALKRKTRQESAQDKLSSMFGDESATRGDFAKTVADTGDTATALKLWFGAKDYTGEEPEYEPTEEEIENLGLTEKQKRRYQLLLKRNKKEADKYLKNPQGYVNPFNYMPGPDVEE